ncbi:molybdenum cofactor biosynthesis protein MoaE [Erythrobacter sp.]|jgi:molybdopterin synthase catalytic subunit|uniref:molybdenum cofactor biosynthesis protein MoaE n=1 Tax=Erythrobacter sp. TaxID=1042 RepID=UPI002EADFD53|nr:molybdenum cofactor biosynthesis protein MoaE [Erythrobacter sp.]
MRDIRVLAEPFAPADAIAALAAATPQAGGIASFTGQVRAGDDVEALELSHYAPLTLPGMQELGEQAGKRFDLLGTTLLHRIGTLRPGDPIVCVAAAACHRRSAFDAVDFCMDHLKGAAWFWKRERRDGEWRWIEPRAEDHADLARWR